MGNDASSRLMSVWWDKDGPALLDQTLLPHHESVLRPRTIEAMEAAINALRVRGAPAIGIAAALFIAGLALASQATDAAALADEVVAAAARLEATRPTAVNLGWALQRMRRRAEGARGLEVEEAQRALLAEALAVREEETAACRAIGCFGAELIKEGQGVLNHCNAGALATGEYGTSLGILRCAWERGTRFTAYVDETRPLLQGARLTAWELCREGIPTILICDNMAGYLMQTGRINAVVVGADRVAANGDIANKIGTYSLAVLAGHHALPFYVAAPASTFDLSLPDGASIPIEERSHDEVKGFGGVKTAPDGVAAVNPAFDITPAGLITAIITDRGLIMHPGRDAVAAIFGGFGGGDCA